MRTGGPPHRGGVPSQGPLARGAAGGGLDSYRESPGEEPQGSQSRVGAGRALRSGLVWSEGTFAGHLDMAWCGPEGRWEEVIIWDSSGLPGPATGGERSVLQDRARTDPRPGGPWLPPSPLVQLWGHLSRSSGFPSLWNGARQRRQLPFKTRKWLLTHQILNGD